MYNDDNDNISWILLLLLLSLSLYIYVSLSLYIYIYIYIHAPRSRGPLVAAAARAGRRLKTPEGTKRATSVNVQLLRLQKDLRTGSISRDIVNFSANSAGAEVACLRIKTFRAAWKTRGGPSLLAWPLSAFLSYRSKGIWRQGIGSFVRNSYVSTLHPVVIGLLLVHFWNIVFKYTSHISSLSTIAPYLLKTSC